ESGAVMSLARVRSSRASIISPGPTCSFPACAASIFSVMVMPILHPLLTPLHKFQFIERIYVRLSRCDDYVRIDAFPDYGRSFFFQLHKDLTLRVRSAGDGIH